jgi:hypothetical protein
MTNLKNGSRSNDARDVSVARVDMKLEVIVIPASTHSAKRSGKRPNV